jgi:hypothetical protein
MFEHVRRNDHDQVRGPIGPNLAVAVRRPAVSLGMPWKLLPTLPTAYRRRR